jgi:NADPH2:quinone reductase
MRAVLSRHPGPPSSLTIEEVEEPRAGPGEVVVRVAAAALNFLDTLIIADRYQVRPERPFSPGAEMAGTVIEVGEGVAGLAPGDRVVGYLGAGCCREAVALPADRATRLPASVPFEAAAGITIAYGTTLYALADRGEMRAGETLAVLGAAGGVGQAAVEIGKLLGATVVACASSQEKLDFARSLGADHLVDYSAENLKERLKALTGGAGVDVVYDPVGGELAEQALRATAWRGRYLVIGFAGGEIPRIPLNLVLLKGCDIRGIFWGDMVRREPATYAGIVRRLLDWLAEGRLKPHVDRIVGLDGVAAALEALQRRDVKGKVLVKP